MKRQLVVIDSSIEASVAVDHAIKIASALKDAELLLLYVEPFKSSWQEKRRPSVGKAPAFVLKRAETRVNAEGIKCRTRHEIGELAERVAQIASEEQCDLIIMPEKSMGPIARAVLMVTGLCASTALRQVIATAPVPVTIISHGTSSP